MRDYSTPNQALISSISVPPSGSAVFVVCLMLDCYFCLSAHLTQDTTTVVAVAPWVWLNAVLYTGRRVTGIDMVRSSCGSIWGSTQHFSRGGGLKKINNIFVRMTGYLDQVWIPDIPDVKQENYSLSHNISCISQSLPQFLRMNGSVVVLGVPQIFNVNFFYFTSFLIHTELLSDQQIIQILTTIFM